MVGRAEVTKGWSGNPILLHTIEKTLEKLSGVGIVKLRGSMSGFVVGLVVEKTFCII
jgi:hypothetical protein